ncbi:hypothetical protein [Streptomyces sp. NPDC029003]|uniref:ATP-binding protein n=1 Tax=Streptomyces sp. NPDC029003 TaxID=3155125 RepID=UPI00340D5220
MTKKQAPQTAHLAIDWVAGHGNVSAPVAMATTAAATASMGAWAGLPGAWPLVVGAVGAAAHGVGVGIRKRLSGPSLAVRAAGWLLASGWSSAVILTDPTSWDASGWWSAVGSLAAISLGVGAGLVRADVHEEALDETRRAMQAAMTEAEINRADWALVDQWVGLIRAVTHVDVAPAGLRRRKDGSGFAMEVALPIGYASNRFQGYAASLAEAARLPVGCLVGIAKARKQGHVILDVDTVDTSTRVTEYPEGFEPLSVLSGLPWGLNRVGEELTVHMREACALILGPPGTGKTTLLDAILTGFARCDDVLVFGIDVGKKGDAFVPWVTPWMEGQKYAQPLSGKARLPETTRQGVDWIAANLVEADLMLDALIAIAEHRLDAYRELMRQADTKLLPVSADIPMIFCVVDEGAEMLAYQGMDPLRSRVKEKLVSVMRTTRAMGIRLILTATDGNLASLGDSAVRKYSPVRIALTCTDPEGAGVAKLFGQTRGLDSSQLTAQGSGVIGAATGVKTGFAPQPFRTWVTAPSLARDACLATQARRPVLDEPSVRVAGDAYRDRWSPARIAWLIGAQEPAATQAAPAGDRGLPLLPGGRPMTTPEQLRARLQNRGKDPAQAPAPGEPVDQDATMAKFLEDLGKLPEVEEPGARPPLKPFKGLEGLRVKGREPGAGPTPEQAAPDWKELARRVVCDSGKWLGTSGVLAVLEGRGLTVNRSTLATELSAMARRGEIAKRGSGPQTEYGAPHAA